MKAFLVGFIFLIAVSLLAGIGILLFPLLIALAWALRFILIIALFAFAVWLLGEFIIFIWEKVIKQL